MPTSMKDVIIMGMARRGDMSLERLVIRPPVTAMVETLTAGRMTCIGMRRSEASWWRIRVMKTKKRIIRLARTTNHHIT